MYKAKILSKEIERGQLVVGVQFTNGKDTFDDAFTVNNGYNGNWISTQVQRRLQELESLETMHGDITLGDFTPTVDTDKQTYQENYQKYVQLMQYAKDGLGDPESTDIIELRQWLRDNFNADSI